MHNMLNANTFTVNAIGLSMYPLVTPGIQLIFEHCLVADVRIGDIISFVTFSKADARRKTLQLITHRVIWKKGHMIYTKGDNNRYIDTPPETEPRYVYRVVGIRYDRKLVGVQEKEYRLLKRLLLGYSYLSLIFPFWMLRGRRFFVRYFIGAWQD